MRLGLVLRGKRLGFDLEEIARIVDMYDQEPGEEGQLRYLLEQIERRRAELEQRRRDIDQTLAELEVVERRCREALAGSPAGAPTAADGHVSLLAVPRTVLVLNAGSSSVKYRLLDPGSGERFADGTVERVKDAGEAVAQVVTDLGDALRQVGEVAAVGHRVVHGGDRFTGPTVVDDGVLAVIDELAALAPLHNPAAAAGIRAARAALPGVPQVAVFDTAFHATLPPPARTYAVPREWRERHGVRRYGFHGTNYAHVTKEAARLLGRDAGEVNLVALHLGNGASACAIRGGVSVDTSMGLTPLAGLVMGTRSGDLDPSVPGYLARVAGLRPDQIEDALEHASGLAGLARRPRHA